MNDFQQALEDGNLRLVKKFLKEGVEINQKIEKEYPLNLLFKKIESDFSEESKKKYLPIIKLLLRNGADPNLNDDNEDNLIDAIKIGDKSTIKLLLEKGADPNRDIHLPGYEPSFVQAVEKDDLSLLKFLMKYGAYFRHPNYLSNYEGEVLSSAIKNKNLKMIKFHLDLGVNPNEKNRMRENHLSKLSLSLEKEIIELLVKYGADIDLPDQHGFSPSKILHTLLSENPDEDIILTEIAKFLCYAFTLENEGKTIYDEIFVLGFAPELNHKYEDNEKLYEKILEVCSSDFNYFQRAQVTPFFSAVPRFSSKRTKIQLDHLFDEINYQPPKVSRKKVKVLDSLEDTEGCFCLNTELGIYDNYYLPVITYRTTLATGLYSQMVVNPSEARFLFYYWEPESPYLLFSPKTILFRNKIQAYYLLTEGKRRNPIFKTYLNNIEELLGIDFKDWLELQEKEEVVLGDYTSYLMKLKEDIPSFAGGYMDKLDSLLSQLTIEKGFDVIVFTHQPGDSYRLVTEVLDVRTRVESIQNIYIAK